MNDLTPERCRQLLATALVAHMGLISEGEPYVSPISFVLLDDSICLRTASGRRVDAMKANPRTCIEVSELDDDNGSWESVIAWGDAEIVEDDATARSVIMALLDKYRPMLGSPLSPGSAFPEPGIVVRIPVGDLSGRSSGSLFSVRTRPGRL